MTTLETWPRFVCGSRPWNRSTFERALAVLPGAWELVEDPEALAAALEQSPPALHLLPPLVVDPLA